MTNVFRVQALKQGCSRTTAGLDIMQLLRRGRSLSRQC